MKQATKKINYGRAILIGIDLGFMASVIWLLFKIALAVNA